MNRRHPCLLPSTPLGPNVDARYMKLALLSAINAAVSCGRLALDNPGDDWRTFVLEALPSTTFREVMMTLSLCSRLPLSRFAALALAGLLVVTLNADRVRAQGAPDSVSFQGLLTNPGGTPINTTTSMTFKLYKNGAAVWTECSTSSSEA